MKPLVSLFAVLALGALPAHADTIVVRAGHLIEPATGAVLADQAITVTDGRVSAVAPWRCVPEGTAVVDWRAYWLLPGLIDCHVHLADVGQTNDPAEPLKHSAEETAYIGARNARLTLNAGFTTVHDV